MIIELNGTQMQTNYGIEFIRQLDKKTAKTIDTKNGYVQTFSEGLAHYAPQLMMQNPVAVVELLECALWEYKGKFTAKDIDQYIDGLTAEEYDDLFDTLVEELEEGKFTRKTMIAMKEAMKETQN